MPDGTVKYVHVVAPNTDDPATRRIRGRGDGHHGPEAG